MAFVIRSPRLDCSTPENSPPKALEIGSTWTDTTPAANKGRARANKAKPVPAAKNGVGETPGAPRTPRARGPSTAAPHPGAQSRAQPPRPPRTPHAPARFPSEALHLPGSRTRPGKITPCNPARTAATAAEPPNRARPLPHASLFPGGRRLQSPGAGRSMGIHGTELPTLTSDSAEEEGAQQKPHGGGPAVGGGCR